MIPIIEKEKADFNKSKFGNNKRVVVVRFPNCIHEPTGKVFKWLPTYKEVADIINALEEIEKESWENDI